MADLVSLSVSGRVTSATTGLGIAGVDVGMQNNAGIGAPFATTDANGDYTWTAAAISANDYRFMTYTPVTSFYLNQAYPGVACFPYCQVGQGTPFDVHTSQVLSHVDFTLDTGGQIAGRVTMDGSGAAVPNSGVVIVDMISLTTFSTTDSAGFFRSRALPAGNYKVYRNKNGFYAGEVYNNHECSDFCNPADGDDVPVAPGLTTPVDMALRATVTVTGRVTDIQGHPLSAGAVSLYNSTGYAGYAGYPDANGNYAISGFSGGGDVAPGSYVAVATPPGNFVPAVNPGIDCGYCDKYATGTHIEVGTQSISGVDITVRAGGSISGTITTSDLAPTPAVRVFVWSLDGRPVLAGQTANCCGGYGIMGLAAGDYRIAARSVVNSPAVGYPLTSLYVGELYAGIPCYVDACDLATGTTVHVGVGATTTGVNLHLRTDAVFHSGTD